ncbi:membrane protein insertase YidC [Blochmannia endosymbiont of Polyrhachis (Hedomyrma) turneri]|uniref:membrane protein insertase YidC n=1 Tax=Blochmannia endosymbiont of Polyrhachis (Hedomyrma) turneri TaxID=1505596 RepID=UPI00061A6760|nr:membrane protein insertase YidC [Blochmannia endosymbiont of Polyrhachis (Hedomyrma) turneri]AKC59608.1 Membrane protein insertase YidC [Blochmannia endosymbiont of Polyrhachis (Hedomyrma) turneri]
MNSQRDFLIISLLIVSLIIWQIWQTDQQIQQKNIDNKNNYQELTINKNHVYNTTNNNNTHNNKIIIIQTDVLLLKINTYGGDIEEAYLLNYSEKLNSKKPFHLLQTSKEFTYQAKSGLIHPNIPDGPFQIQRPLYTTNNNQNNRYILKNNQKTIHVPLYYTNNNGIKYTKTYVLNKNDFSVHVHYNINNTSAQTQTIELFGNLIQSIHYPKSRNNNNFLSLYNYRNTAYSTVNKKYQKYSFKDIKNHNLHIITEQNGWISILEQYFITAWYPTIPNNSIIFYTKYLNNDKISINFKTSPIDIPANNKHTLKTILWIGPKIQEKMALIAPNLELTIDYGWLWFISQPLFKLLQFIHHYIHNWGFAIIIITLIIRFITYPLTKAQYISIAKIRLLQPKLTKIHNQFKNDKYKYHQAIMTLYKSENVNPLGGCLPLIIQMPIFLALYYMLSSSIELRHAKFALWIHDLSSQDPLYILPIIMGITMFLIQRLSPSTSISNPMQKKIMTFMLIIFTIFFLWFPSGLVLYYIISNIITIVQQQIIYHELEKKGLTINNKNK